MMQRLLITGGSGFLGAELVRQALATGMWDVLATYHTQPVAHAGVQFFSLDLDDQTAVHTLITALRPTAIIHTAYVQHGENLRAVTTLGAGYVAEAAQRIGARLIHMSSDALFDGERDGAYTEADVPNPITPYGAAKAEAEQLVAAAHPTALIARTSLIYGGDGSSVHEQFVLQAIDKQTNITFFTDEIRNPVLVGDLAGALLELLALDVGGVLHVAGANAVSRAEFAQLIAAAHGRSPAHLRFARSADSGLRRPRNCAMDSSVAQHIITTRLRGARDVLA